MMITQSFSNLTGAEALVAINELAKRAIEEKSNELLFFIEARIFTPVLNKNIMTTLKDMGWEVKMADSKRLVEYKATIKYQ